MKYLQLLLLLLFFACRSTHGQPVKLQILPIPKDFRKSIGYDSIEVLSWRSLSGDSPDVHFCYPNVLDTLKNTADRYDWFGGMYFKNFASLTMRYVSSVGVGTKKTSIYFGDSARITVVDTNGDTTEINGYAYSVAPEEYQKKELKHRNRRHKLPTEDDDIKDSLVQRIYLEGIDKDFRHH